MIDRQTLDVRPGTVRDSEAVSQLVRGLFAEEGEPPPHTDAARLRRDAFGAGIVDVDVICLRATPIACLLSCRNREHGGQGVRGNAVRDVLGLYVHPPLRRRGLGRALMRSAARRAAAEEAVALCWYVRRDNRTARRFYEAFARPVDGVVPCLTSSASFERLLGHPPAAGLRVRPAAPSEPNGAGLLLARRGERVVGRLLSHPVYELGVGRLARHVAELSLADDEDAPGVALALLGAVARGTSAQGGVRLHGRFGMRPECEAAWRCHFDLALAEHLVYTVAPAVLLAP